jgi:hypothetical protein
LAGTKTQTELRKVKKEISALKKKLTALQARKAEIEPKTGAGVTYQNRPDRCWVDLVFLVFFSEGQTIVLCHQPRKHKHKPDERRQCDAQKVQTPLSIFLPPLCFLCGRALSS